ncbi:hypothetical protein F9C28_11030 [Shimwellia pseudoproteus]|uniref:autotransporter-associated beta strand repeat-containing protein n=1 Tax=Shimwellia pseudoproteus TaxID=570012 RepID=UPI0018EAAB7B|nr:autotransporter-associated beta strand repeat-containing protein [Shimwellia pseudoproteus]MBJ3815447.1 hypothetical protein [Shimwellia pseudoproteus]
MNKKKAPRLPNVALCISMALMVGSLSLPVWADNVLSVSNTLNNFTSDNLNGDNQDYTNYDEVRVTTTDPGRTGNPLSGFGIYLDGGNYKFHDLFISTTGAGAHGILSGLVGGSIIMDDFTVHTDQPLSSGSSSTFADGIRLNPSSGSTVVINNNASINIGRVGNGISVYTADSTGAVNSVVVNGNANIQTMSPVTSSGYYAVFAGKYNSGSQGRAIVELNGNSTIQSLGYGVVADGGATISLNNATVEVSGPLRALYARAGTLISGAPRSAIINLGGDITLTANGAAAALAHSGGIIRSWDYVNDVATSGVYNIEGNLIASDHGLIDLSMANGSLFTGRTIYSDSPSFSASTLNLRIDGPDSIWTMTDNSLLTSLTLDNRSTLRYGRVADISTDAFILGSGGGVVDTNGFNNTLNSIISGDGALSKTGAGTLLLTGVNTYTGGTSVQEGTLQLDPTYS